jgi:hypothetical protein
MARKNSPKTAAKAKSAGIVAKTEAAAPVIVATSPVRNTPLPKAFASAPVIGKATPAQITWDQISARASELYHSGVPGSADDHWFQAERELKGV